MLKVKSLKPQGYIKLNKKEYLTKSKLVQMLAFYAEFEWINNSKSEPFEVEDYYSYWQTYTFQKFQLPLGYKRHDEDAPDKGGILKAMTIAGNIEICKVTIPEYDEDDIFVPLCKLEMLGEDENIPLGREVEQLEAISRTQLDLP